MNFLSPVLRRILATFFLLLFVLAAIAYLPHAAGWLALLAVVLFLPVPAWQQLLERWLKKVQPLVSVAVALSVFLAAPTSRELPPVSTPSLPTATTMVTTRTTATTAEQEATYILNRSSKKFHLPSCANGQKIKEENRLTYTGTQRELKEDGYSPCGNCLP